MFSRFCFHLLVFAVSCHLSFALAEDVNTEPVADWVVERSIDPATYLIDAPADGGLQILLDDMQVRYTDEGPQVYRRLIMRLRSLGAIEKAGTQTVIYTPAYQTYQINHLQVWRDGQAIDMLPAAKVTFTRHEVAPGTPQHEGVATIQFYPPNLRRGDVLDMATRIDGQNSAFKDHVIQILSIAAAQKTHNVFRRYSIPATRNITVLRHAGFPGVEPERVGKELVYEWKWDELDPFFPEEGTPDWYPQVPIMIMSDFASWRDVAEWAEELFELPDAYPGSIQTLAAELVNGQPTDLARMQAILNFMQSEIRYVGMEIGRNGYKPFDPDVVLARRFGDCKDQAMLMVALLKEAGISAKPALVNSHGRKPLELLGITPAAFNHVIVKADVDGEIYWLDPTRHLIAGRTANLTPPRFERALVLHDGASNLTTIPLMERDPDNAQISVIDHFTILNGLSGKARWTRTSITSGDTAEELRKIVENAGVRQIGVSLREAARPHHDGLESNELTTFNDDGTFVTLSEDYILPHAGNTDPNDNRIEFEYRPRNIESLLVRPSQVLDRKTPFALVWPARRRTVFRVTAPDVVFKEFDQSLESKYHKYHNVGRMVGDTFEMTIDYETLMDHVPAADIAQHAEEIKLIWSEIFIRLWSDSDDEAGAIYAYQPAGNRSRDVDLSPGEVAAPFIALQEIFDSNLPEGEETHRAIKATLDSLDGEMKTNFLRSFLDYFISQRRYEDALFIHDQIIEDASFTVPSPYFEKGVTLFRMGRDEESIASIRKAIALQEETSPASEVWYTQLRSVYWHMKDYAALTKQLNDTIASDRGMEQHYRELGVAYDLLGDTEEAKRIRRQMAAKDYADVAIEPLSDDSDRLRPVRPLLRSAPVYPPRAQLDGVQGYVDVRFTVREDGSTVDCTVIKAEPSGYFEEAGCDAVRYFIYYPPTEDDPPGDVNGVETRLTFKFSD